MGRQMNCDGQETSHPLHIARAINQTVCKFQAELSGDIRCRKNFLADLMFRQREQLAKCKPQNLIDALIIVDSAKSIARVLLTGDLEDLGHSSIRLAASELRHALEGISEFLEKESGVTAESLGLNPTGTHWQ